MDYTKSAAKFVNITPNLVIAAKPTMWKPVLKYNKPTISPTHHRKDAEILARVVLHISLKTRKRPSLSLFDVYTGGSVIEASEDGKMLKVELDEYCTDYPPVFLTFELTDVYPSVYGCQQIKQRHRLETLNYKLFVFTHDNNIVESQERSNLFYSSKKIMMER